MTDDKNPAYADPIDAALVTEAAQFAWAGASTTEPASIKLRQAQADADRHLRNCRHLGGLLERIARTIGADPIDLNELPALVDGLRTRRDQLSIQAADHAHALDRAEAGATFWKTCLVRETNQLRDQLTKARTATTRAEARAGAYLLAHDHLDAVTRTLVKVIHQHVTREPLGVHHLLTQADRDRILDALDTVHDALSRDLESYLAEPYDDITPDTRVDLTPAGKAIAATLDSAGDTQELPKAMPNGTERPGEHWNARLIREQAEQRVASSVPPVARENDVEAGVSDPTDEMVEAFRAAADAEAERLVAAGVSLADLEPGSIIREGLAAAFALMPTDEPDLMTPGMADPCQPIGCDNGIHLVGCVYADVDEDQGDPNRTDRALETIGVVGDIVSARLASLGTVDYPDGTSRLLAAMADDARRDRLHAEARRGLSWLDILSYAFWAAMAEEDPARLRPALVTLAAYAAAWAEAIDRRPAAEDQDLAADRA